MKQRLYLSIIISLCISLIACNPIEVCGLEEFSYFDSSVGITRQLFPDQSFLDDFPYLEGEYCYYSEEDLVWGHETVMAYITYDASTYQRAKTHCIDNFMLCPEHQYECCGCLFSEILHRNSTATESIEPCNLPKLFNMFAFDDEHCVLYFIGFWDEDPNATEKTLVADDFPLFLHANFPDLYRILETNIV